MLRSLIVLISLTFLVLLGFYGVRVYPDRVDRQLERDARRALQAVSDGFVLSVSERVLTLEVLPGRDDRLARAVLEPLSGLREIRVSVHTVSPDAALRPTPVAPASPAPAALPNASSPSDTAPPTPAGASATDASSPSDDASSPPSDAASPDASSPSDIAPPTPADASSPDASSPSDTPPATPVDAASPDAAPVADVGQTVAPASPAPLPPELDPTRPLTARECQDRIALLIEGPERITFFPRGGRLTPEGDAKVVAIYHVLERCPRAKGIIAGYHDNLGDPDEIRRLTYGRALGVHKRLVELGMTSYRFRAAGYGYQNMRYGVSAATRELNQRVEFLIKGL